LLNESERCYRKKVYTKQRGEMFRGISGVFPEKNEGKKPLAVRELSAIY
jgi:hypothetical protein